VFGHLGDYHLHINIVPRNLQELTQAKKLYEDLMSNAISAGGTVSGGTWDWKIETVFFEDDVWGKGNRRIMTAIKTAFDPELAFKTEEIY